ncbi:MAG: cytochrome c [Verrucomicrobiales bacterium]
MRYFFLGLILAAVLVISMAGFRGHRFSEPPVELLPDMDRNAKIKYQAPADFFADGVGSRLPVAGTVPMGFEVPGKPAAAGAIDPTGFTHADDYYNTGKMGEFWGDGFPEQVQVDAEFLRRGALKFEINCAICHGSSGDGQGVTSKFGFANIANLHLPMFTDASRPDYRPDGSIFDTISHGRGLMGSYGGVLTIQDRWAVVAYVRVLQKSRNQSLEALGLTAEEFESLASSASPSAAAAPAGN